MIFFPNLLILKKSIACSFPRKRDLRTSNLFPAQKRAEVNLPIRDRDRRSNPNLENIPCFPVTDFTALAGNIEGRKVAVKGLDTVYIDSYSRR